MANFDRGVYEPREEAHDGVRVYDGSEEEDDIEGSRLPLLIVLALLVLAMFAGVVWLAYTQGVARGRGETPVLAAANGPERVAPQDGGGNTVPYQGFKIYEQPAPQDDSADTASPVAPTPAAPKPPPAQASAPAAAPVVTPKMQTPPQTPPKAAAAPAKVATPPKTVAALIQQANSAPEPAKPAPAANTSPPAMKPAVTASAPGPATGAPRPLAASAQPPAAAPAAAPKALASTGYVLQIGAYKSQADAESAWKTYKAKHAALLTGYSENVQQADLGEKGTWYRLRIGGFSDREVANALCDRLKADGGACIPGR